ncbi:MAG TPA: MBL fold metallo-hydrolase [Kofleriaceae bacterium]|nr:MBL fold metallo-hydrolase [Kofleriaceae bacterium]
MARLADSLPSNASGDLYVDRTCIDCDLCRQLAPSTFGRDDRAGQSHVRAQPADDDGRHRALMALVTCPTASIGMTRKLDTRAASHAFPTPVPGAAATDLAEVRFCGYASADSYGASSWLVLRPDGNVLVDSPRAAAALMNEVAALGGVRWMFLTHQDDVADHAAWRERFGCERVLHRDDIRAGTRDVERIIDGHDPVRLADDLLVIPVPGHTRGSSALLYRDAVLFSGDHVWADDDETGLDAGRDVCWYSWPEQRRSVARLADHTFTHVLPGHGRPFHAASPAAMRAAIDALSRAMM